ncbi:MAG: hypothetical protein IBJ16_07230, partial [Chitinophagaceae bacterium]|nr:hypothetical protein [Chitinophagaceae bacterium]
MKKLSGFLVAALLVGVASAFTTKTSKQPSVAWGFDGVEWHMVDPADINNTFACLPGNDYCLYDQPNG